ncbi:transferase [Xylariales sp. AK1849]|nr:transferase [Xylariales sp. AK1849]
MDGHVDFAISGPPFDVKFSHVDQVTPPIYSRRILVFSRQDDDRKQAVLALRKGLQRTVNEIPILAGQMGHTSTGWTVKNGQALLRVKDVDMSFSELQSTNFSEAMLPADVLSSVPSITDPQFEWHACRIQANFIRGGLLLVISINHTTMDGYGITIAIETLARNCRAHDPIASFEPVSLDRSAISACDGDADIGKLAAYSIVRGATKIGSIPARTVTTTFRLPVAALQALKTDASPAEGWVTTHDAVNALCWRTHARGRFRAKIISDEENARFAFPVEFRQLIDPPLSPHYIGNAVLMTKVELPVKTLLGPDGLSIAAATIRAGVRKVDAAYVGNFVAVAKSLESPGQLKISLKLEQPNTAFGSTSYKGFAHGSLDWDPVLGKFERLRLASGVTGEGMSIILPVLGDGSWEVTVTLEEDLVELFKTDDEWRRYAS